jgi:hypothetical protein
MDSATITALAALFTALATLLLVCFNKRQLNINNEQLKLNNLALSVDLVIRLEKRFDDDLITQRRAAAHALENLTEENESDIEPILDFFETLGLLTRRKALDEEFVWSYFFYWFYGYWRVSKDIVKKQRKKWKTRYQDLVWLEYVLMNLERQKRGELDESEWEYFIEEEKTLS